MVFYGTLEGYLKAVDEDRAGAVQLQDPVRDHRQRQHLDAQGQAVHRRASGIGGWAGIGLAAGLTEDTAGLGAVGAYKALSNYTQLGGVLTVLPCRRILLARQQLSSYCHRHLGAAASGCRSGYRPDRRDGRCACVR